ncbi:TetR/AcrR family transcriptional regulator [Streptomyces sp. TP-A0874]|uniref:TetR/AcrR family transcriptional regulator n=1 Tax=Streptomyces sp. TP-A0874 TaxID=549819 RepID=UPI00099FF208|nr:helix-turn-helix domain-containing protein [Streptomyces sp. TP-A0874]
MRIFGSQSSAVVGSDDEQTTTDVKADGGGLRPAPLRVDARRNLEHVLRAAREVFGELGYGAPMEDVARRARVGVGTVYRRFPSKEVLVRRIAEQETARLTEQARAALAREDEPWSALARFLRTSVASGAGRLLPPQVLVGADIGVGVGSDTDHRVPHQRRPDAEDAEYGAAESGDTRFESTPFESTPFDSAESAPARPSTAQPSSAQSEAAEPEESWGTPADPAEAEGPQAPEREELRLAELPSVERDPASAALLEVVGELVERARAAGELRGDVTVADVLLVIATAAPSLPDPAQQEIAAGRLLEILLEGLRPRYPA